MGSDIQTRCLDLAWSLLTELGAPGLARRHTGVAIDPEPAVLLAAGVQHLDPRLRDQLGRWLLQHGDRLSRSRLTGLLKDCAHRLQANASEVALAVGQAGGPRLPTPADVPSPAWAPDRTPLALPISRPALVRFRLRALSGVGARADVLAELLERSGTWTRTLTLADRGYTRRAVGGILAELVQAGIVERHAQGNAHRFRLRDPVALSAAVDGGSLRTLDLIAGTRLVERALDLDVLEALPETVRRVEAAKLHTAFADLAVPLDVRPPPGVRGQPEAWSILRNWTTSTLERLGSSA